MTAAPADCIDYFGCTLAFADSNASFAECLSTWLIGNRHLSHMLHFLSAVSCVTDATILSLTMEGADTNEK
jgi:hypothetical protein